MVERAIFAHDDNDMLDRGIRLAIIGVGAAQVVVDRISVASHQRENGRCDNGAIA